MRNVKFFISHVYHRSLFELFQLQMSFSFRWQNLFTQVNLVGDKRRGLTKQDHVNVNSLIRNIQSNFEGDLYRKSHKIRDTLIRSVVYFILDIIIRSLLSYGLRLKFFILLRFRSSPFFSFMVLRWQGLNWHTE